MLPAQQWVFMGCDPVTNIQVLAPVQRQDHVLVPTFPPPPIQHNELEKENVRLKTENQNLKANLVKLDAMCHNLFVTYANENNAFRNICNQLSYEKSSWNKTRRKQNNTINVLRARLEHAEDKLRTAELEYQQNVNISITNVTENTALIQPIYVKQDLDLLPEVEQNVIVPEIKETEDQPDSNLHVKDETSELKTELIDVTRETREAKLGDDFDKEQEIKSVQPCSSISSSNNTEDTENAAFDETEKQICQIISKNEFIVDYAQYLSTLPQDSKVHILRLQNDLQRVRKELRTKINELHRVKLEAKNTNMNFNLIDQIDDLKQQLKEKEQLLNNIEVNYETRLKENKENFQTELNKQESILASKYKVEDYNLEKRIQIETNLVEARKKCIVLEADKKQLNDILRNLSQKNEMLKKEVTTLKNENRQCKQDLEQIKQQQLSSDNFVRINEELKREQEKNTILLIESEHRSTEICKLKLENSGLHENITQITKSLKQAEAELKNLVESKLKVEDEISQARIDISELNKLISNLESQNTKENLRSHSDVEKSTPRKFNRDELLVYQTCKLSVEKPLNLKYHEICQKTTKNWQVIDFDQWNPQYTSCESEDSRVSNEITHTIQIAPIKNKCSLKDEDVLKQSRSILNKLTPEKFDKLLGQFKDLSITSISRLTGVAEILLAKASQESHFAEMYARLCQGLIELKVKEGSGVEYTFQTAILSLCNREFERIGGKTEDCRRSELVNKISETAEPSELKVQLEEYDVKIKKKNVGFCTFLGELFRIRLIDSSTLLTLIDSLTIACNEESIECLCKIMKKVGATLEADECNKSMMNKIFNDIKSKLDQTDVTSSRLRFMLMDLYELRILNWIPRRKESKPVTLAEIDKEVENEHTYSEPKVSQSMSNWRPKAETKNNRMLEKSNYPSSPQCDRKLESPSVSSPRSRTPRSIELSPPRVKTEKARKPTLASNKPDTRATDSPLSYSKALATTKPKLPPPRMQGMESAVSLMPDYKKRS